MDSRIAAALLLYTFTVLGVFLLVAPWTPVWGQAVMALLPAALAEPLLGGWARGLASALGALDLIVAVQVAVELRERMRAGGAKG